MGAVGELATGVLMQSRLGEVGEVYEQGDAGAGRGRRAATACGAALLVVGGRGRRPVVVAGCVLLLTGGACEGWAVYRAGLQSAWDPKYVVKPQRER